MGNVLEDSAAIALRAGVPCVDVEMLLKGCGFLDVFDSQRGDYTEVAVRLRGCEYFFLSLRVLKTFAIFQNR